jgi:hypothetical protein
VLALTLALHRRGDMLVPAKVLRPVGAGTVLYGAQLIAGHLSAERDIEQAGKEDPAIATSGYPFLCNGYGKRMQSAETID